MQRQRAPLPLRPLRTTCAAATLLALAGAAQAQFSTDGYLRAGTGAGVKNNSSACFGLAGDSLKYRLGNECDNFVEINLKNTVKVGSLQFSGNIMPVYWSQAQETANPTSLGQAFIEGTGFDFAPGVNIWAGKRYYGRSDVHITDTKYTKLDGTGGGVDNIDLGFGKLGVAYFRRDTGFAGWGTASRLNVEFSTNNVNPGGWLRVLATGVDSEDIVDKDGNALEGRSGSALTVQHYQHNLFGLGGGNTLYLQFARGSAGLDGNFQNAFSGNGNDWIDSDPTASEAWLEEHRAVKRARIADAFTWQVGNFGGQVLAHLQEDDNNQYKTRSTSFGGRVSYAFTTNFKLVGEAGLSEKKPGSAEKQRLAKFTIAPTVAVGKGFWDRPELRLFYTRAKWNDAAAADTTNNLPTGRTSANRYGVQAEIWW